MRIESYLRRVDPHLLNRAAHALELAARTAEGNGLRCHQRRRWTSPRGARFPISEAELTLTLPSRWCEAGGNPPVPARHRSPMLPLGRTRDGSVVGPEVEPDQGRHLAILGETGMGKSSLLVAIGRRVVDGAGLVLFDPLGDTARALRDGLPSGVEDRLLWIDPREGAGLNALEGIGRTQSSGDPRPERQLNDLVHSLRRVRSGRYSDSGFWGPRLEEMLTRALAAAAACPGGTLVDAHALLASGGRGFRTVPTEAMDVVRELTDRIRSRPEDADGARRLLYEVTRSPTLVRMLCDRQPALRAQDLVAPGRVVLISGDAATVGESSARYLLSVYLALVWSELLSADGESKTYVVLDEAQWFAHESLAEMLRLGRRRNVHVVLATQSIASLPEPVADAVWTNVADFVAFRGSPEEAREFARATHTVSSEAILALARGEAAVLLGKGNSVHWIRTARTGGLPVGASGPRTGPTPDAEYGPAGSPSSDPAEVTDVHRFPREVPGSQDVLEAIVRRVRATGVATPVRISLVDLRRELDPTGRAVRAAGGILGRSGALLRTGRDDAGAYWWVDPTRIRTSEEQLLSDSDGPVSVPSQPS